MEKIEAQNVKLKIINRKLKYELEKLKEIEEEHRKINGQLRKENKQLKEQLNLAENILYDYLYKDGKITKELYFKIKDYKELNGLKN